MLIFAATQAYAQTLGLDMSGHRTTSVQDFVPQEGDYLLAMEVRHLRKLAANAALAHLPRGLLGNYVPFPLPHLHDPYGLDDRYMAHCLQRIERAVEGLVTDFPGAMLSSPSASDRAVRGEGPTG